MRERARERARPAFCARARARASPSRSASCGLALGEAGHPGFLCRGFCLRGSQLIGGLPGRPDWKVRRRSRALSKQAGGHAPRSRCAGTFSQRAEEGIGVGRPGSLSLVGLTARGHPPSSPRDVRLTSWDGPATPARGFSPGSQAVAVLRAAGCTPTPCTRGSARLYPLGRGVVPGAPAAGPFFWGGPPLACRKPVVAGDHKGARTLSRARGRLAKMHELGASGVELSYRE